MDTFSLSLEIERIKIMHEKKLSYLKFLIQLEEVKLQENIVYLEKRINKYFTPKSISNLYSYCPKKIDLQDA